MTVISELSRLESAGLIQLAQYEPELEYLFRHALVQDAAYGTLLQADRKRLHHAVGKAVEALYTDRLDELSAMLARHFQQAGDEQHALDYYLRAGESALTAFANKEAESLFRNALALSCSQPQRAVLLSNLGEALFRQSRLDEAIETWREGIAICDQLDDQDGMARLDHVVGADRRQHAEEQQRYHEPAAEGEPGERHQRQHHRCGVGGEALHQATPVADAMAPASLSTSSSSSLSAMMKGGASSTWSPWRPSMVPDIG